MAAEARRYLEATASGCAPTGSVSTRRSLPVRSLVALAARVAADVVVMATSGRTGMARFLAGSVTHGTIRASAVPVLVVPPGWGVLRRRRISLSGGDLEVRPGGT